MALMSGEMPLITHPNHPMPLSVPQSCMDRTRAEVLKCLEQYNCLFGPIREAWCDNAQEFHSADLLLRRYSIDPEFLNKHGNSLSLNNITFHFGIPYASWRQSQAERYVRVVKRAIIKQFSSLKNFTENELEHHLIVASSIVNDRPLGVIDQQKGTEILSPRLLMLGKTSQP